MANEESGSHPHVCLCSGSLKHSRRCYKRFRPISRYRRLDFFALVAYYEMLSNTDAYMTSQYIVESCTFVLYPSKFAVLTDQTLIIIKIIIIMVNIRELDED